MKDVPDWAADIVPLAQAVTRRLLSDRSGWRVLHGDLHPRNIIKHQDAWRVIDPRAIIGPPAFEYANLFINPWDRKDLIFQPGRMDRIARHVSVQQRCDSRDVVSCAIANALYYATLRFPFGQGRHPINCMRLL